MKKVHNIEEEIIKLSNDGVTTKEIAAKFNYTVTSINMYKKKLGLRSNKVYKIRDNTLAKMEEIKILHKKGLTIKEIATNMSLSYAYVGALLRKLNLKHNQDPNGNIPIEMIDGNHAKCKKCGEIKELKYFGWVRRKSKGTEYRLAYCNSCRRNVWLSYINSDIKKVLKNKFNYLEKRIKNSNIDFDLTLEDYIAQYEKQKGKCFYTNKDMISIRGVKTNKYTSSLDRIIPEKGYIKGNIVFCTFQANTVKNNLTLDELKQWIPKWYKKIEEYLNERTNK